MRSDAGRGAIGKKLAGKSAQKPRLCACKGLKLWFDAGMLLMSEKKEAHSKNAAMQQSRCRNADSETPMQKRRFRNAILERYCTKAMRSVGFDVPHAAQEIK